jgi:hypothetical protein
MVDSYVGTGDTILDPANKPETDDGAIDISQFLSMKLVAFAEGNNFLDELLSQ